jgi:hypothetical protein
LTVTGAEKAPPASSAAANINKRDDFALKLKVLTGHLPLSNASGCS